MKPSFRNLFRKKFTRDRVVPIISASASCETGGSVCRGLLRERYATVGLGEEEETL